MDFEFILSCDDNNRFKPRTTVTILVTRGAALSLLGERGGAAELAS